MAEEEGEEGVTENFSVRVPLEAVRGQWGSKIDALLRDLLSLLASPECDGEKAIVFSQWVEVTAPSLTHD